MEEEKVGEEEMVLEEEGKEGKGWGVGKVVDSVEGLAEDVAGEMEVGVDCKDDARQCY